MRYTTPFGYALDRLVTAFHDLFDGLGDVVEDETGIRFSSVPPAVSTGLALRRDGFLLAMLPHSDPGKASQIAASVNDVGVRFALRRVPDWLAADDAPPRSFGFVFGVIVLLCLVAMTMMGGDFVTASELGKDVLILMVWNCCAASKIFLLRKTPSSHLSTSFIFST